MPAELDVRRVSGRAAFLPELRFFPIDPDVRVRAVVEQLLRELERGYAAAWRRGRMSRVADAGCAVAARLAQPRQRVERGAARIGRVRIRPAVDEHRGEI